MQRIIAISNQKGGVGKTTTAVNLAASLAALGKKVLIIDMDPQGNASSGVGVDRDRVASSTYQILLGLVPVEKAIVSAGMARLDVVPSNRELVGAEIELIQESRREFRLRTGLQSLSTSYDFVMIDCPPSLNILTVNALTAAHSVLIPLQCEYYAMEGLGELIRTLKLVKNRLNPALEREGILLTMFDRRNRLSHQVGEEVRKLFGALVFDTHIPRNVRLSESPSFGQPAFRYNARSVGAQAYMALAHELLGRLESGPEDTGAGR